MSFLKNLLNMGHHGRGNRADGNHAASNTSHQQRGKHHGGSQSHGANQRNDWGNTAVTQNNCIKCNAGNLAVARFCQQCGNAMLPKNCAACGTVKMAGAKFCANCGTPQ
jgi:Double zinc ribbon